MTRFEKELSGMLGEFWKKSAEKQLQQTKDEIANGSITIDGNGIARNRMGRVVMSDLGEIIAMVSDDFDAEATDKAREKETAEFIKEYKKQQENREYSVEELAEMRNAFGEGTTVVDIFSGKEMKL